MAPKAVYHVRLIHLMKTRTVEEGSGICFQKGLFMFCFVSIKRSTYRRGLKPFFYYIPELILLS